MSLKVGVPKLGVAGCCLAYQVGRRFAGEVPIVKGLAVMWENDFGTEFIREVGACSVPSRAQRACELIGNARFRDVKQDCVAGLGLMENEVASGL